MWTDTEVVAYAPAVSALSSLYFWFHPQSVRLALWIANGNRILATSLERGISGQSASFNLGDQLESAGNNTYEYDANGRLSKKTTSTPNGAEVTTYEYSSQGQLKRVETPEHVIEYRHNALGNRVAKLKDGDVVEQYLWQDKTTLLATYDGDGNLKQRFEYTLGHTPTSFTENGETYFVLSDQLGSPRVIAASAGQVIKTIEYDAYGNVISDSQPSFTIPFGFAGGLRDADTGLIRFGYRDYHPDMGRWTAQDPIGFAGGDPNLYGYVSSDVITWNDLVGLARNNGVIGDQIKRSGPVDQSGRVGRVGNAVTGPHSAPPSTVDKIGNAVADKAVSKMTGGGFRVDSTGTIKPVTKLGWLKVGGWAVGLWAGGEPISCSELDCNDNGVPDPFEKEDHIDDGISCRERR